MLVTLIANISLQSVSYLFILFIVSFAVPKLLSLSRSHLCIFVFISIILGDRPKGYCCDLCQKGFYLFSSRTFIVSSFTFRSLIHLSLHSLELNLFCVWQHHFLKRLFLPLNWLSRLSQKPKSKLPSFILALSHKV